MLIFLGLDCNIQNCSTCFNAEFSECTFCYTAGACRSYVSCGSGSNYGRCPSLTSVGPNSSTIFGNSYIAMAVDVPLTTGQDYRCRFGTHEVPGNISSGGTILCQTPAVPSPAFLAPDLYIGAAKFTVMPHNYLVDFYGT